MAYTNSSLVSYTKISPNKTSPRNHVIDTITIHCVVGQASIEALGNEFSRSSKGASSNYGVGYDGRIGMYVEEKDRSWCSSSSSNDNRAITIEVASDTTHPYAVTDKALASLIELVADICKRNNIKELKWKGDRTLIGKVDKQNMTVHRWFANKSCPGDYLYNKHPYIVEQVNKKLGTTITPTESKELYRIRKSWDDAASQTGAYSSLENAKAACKDGYFVFDSKGKIVYPTIIANKINSFLPPRGYFKKGDVSVNIGKIATFMRKYFPTYTSRAALGNVYGDNLIKAVKEFQRRTGLEPDGYFGKLTLAELKKYGFKE